MRSQTSVTCIKSWLEIRIVTPFDSAKSLMICFNLICVVGSKFAKGSSKIIKEGWWEMPKDLQSEWTFHALSTKYDCAQMYVYDFDKDGDMDILSSSAHDYGIWWNETKSLYDSS